jgi:hypothetical protein
MAMSLPSIFDCRTKLLSGITPVNSRVAFVLLVSSVLLAGCRQGWEADYSKLDLAEVSGRVTLDGKPLTNATVSFECEDKTYSFGTTDDQGNYKLMFDTIKSGALPGPKTVRIKQGGSGEGTEAAPSENPDGTVTTTKDAIPACYGAKSQLQVKVEGSIQTFNFDLKSDCSVKGPTG